MRCLFIGESPPGREGIFFYNPQKEGPFRKNIFGLLEIDKSGYDGLCDFKRRGFLLTDVLKCRVNKEGKTIPRNVTRNCLEILKLEIELLSKNVKKIVVLGKTALEALKMLGFSEPKGLSVTKNKGEIVKSQGFEIFICTLPFAITKRYWDTPEVRDSLRRFVRYA